MKILLVEDDPKVGRFVQRAFFDEGYQVEWCHSGLEVKSLISTGEFDLIVLDWMLPDQDGVAVCKELRAAGVLASILMLTARSETKDRVIGLEAGADDYVPKPFEVEELLARVKALLRRSKHMGKLHIGALEIDRISHIAQLDSLALSLTSREYALLSFLASRAENAVSRAEVLENVWGGAYDPSSNLVEVHVSRLREKLGAHAWMIETVRGAGYRLRQRLYPAAS
jgi:DNA-binding response OmpR family regulator